jgi:hypothetical protein
VEKSAGPQACCASFQDKEASLAAMQRALTGRHPVPDDNQALADMSRRCFWRAKPYTGGKLLLTSSVYWINHHRPVDLGGLVFSCCRQLVVIWSFIKPVQQAWEQQQVFVLTPAMVRTPLT